MPKSTFVELRPEERRQILAALRRARYGYLLTLHILLWCAAGRKPTMIAAVLFGSRSSVYRTVRADQEGTLGLEHDDHGRLLPPLRCAGRWWPCSRRPRGRMAGAARAGEDHLDRNGPWKYKLSDLYYEPAVTAAVENIAAKEHATGAA